MKLCTITENEYDEYEGLEDEDQFGGLGPWFNELSAFAERDHPLTIFVSHPDGDMLIFCEPGKEKDLQNYITNPFATSMAQTQNYYHFLSG